MMLITLSIQFHVECTPLPWIVTSSSSCLFVFVFMLNCTTEWSGVRWSELWNQHKNYHSACTTFHGIMRRICNNWTVVVISEKGDPRKQCICIESTRIYLKFWERIYYSKWTLICKSCIHCICVSFVSTMIAVSGSIQNMSLKFISE